MGAVGDLESRAGWERAGQGTCAEDRAGWFEDMRTGDTQSRHRSRPRPISGMHIRMRNTARPTCPAIAAFMLRPPEGLTALHVATRNGRASAAQALIDGKADIEALDEVGTEATLMGNTDELTDSDRVAVERRDQQPNAELVLSSFVYVYWPTHMGDQSSDTSRPIRCRRGAPRSRLRVGAAILLWWSCLSRPKPSWNRRARCGDFDAVVPQRPRLNLATSKARR